MDTVIRADGLCKSFRGQPAVDHLSFEVPRGAIFALLGDNGAGRTTTIRMLTGLLRPDAGRASILGQDCWRAAVGLRHKVGYVPERPRFYDWMTVSEIGWFTAGFHHAEFGPRYEKLTDRFRLDPRARLKHLSMGQYAKVGLALALAVDPEVLILDEPTSGLDLLVRREFLASMVDLAGEGRTILISSHQIAEVECIVSHVAFIAGGRLLLSATAEELGNRFLRVRLRFESHAPDPTLLGTVVERNGSGNQWQSVLRDPRRAAIDKLRAAEGISEFAELPLRLVWPALMVGRRDGLLHAFQDLRSHTRRNPLERVRCRT